MNEAVATPLSAFALCSVILFAKMFAISLVQGWQRISNLAFKTPEDARFVGRAPAAEELPMVLRAANAWRNDLESIPAFWALGVVYLMVGASPAAAPWLFGVFTAARVAHTVTYLLALQPWRTLAYSVAIGCLLGMCGAIVAAL